MEQAKKRVRFDLIIIAITALSFIATILIYPSLPAMIPYHWSIGGNVKTIGKWVAFITALVPLFIYYVAKLRLKKNQTEASSFLIAMIFVVLNWVLILIAKG